MSANGTNTKTALEVARRFFLHDPATLAQSYVWWAEKLQAEPGVTFGCILDRYIIPLHPGDMTAIVARPGMGKSSFMAYMARREALAIIARQQGEKACVIYVSWEQAAEEVEAFFQSGGDYTSSDLAWGRASLDLIKRQAVKRVHLPIWLIGESVRHAGARRPEMTVDYVYSAIEALVTDHGLRPTLICLDYLQKIPIENQRERNQQVTEAAHRTKQLAMRIGCPVLVGVQAGRGVDDYKNPIPTMADAQWSSAIEQNADKQLALWRPIRTYDPTERPSIKVAGREYLNTEDLFVVRLLKQRFDAGFGTWAIHFRPQTLAVRDYETREPAQ